MAPYVLIKQSGAYLMKRQFADETLQEARVESTGYNTYSFRIGAATTAKTNGISDVHIKILGR